MFDQRKKGVEEVIRKAVSIVGESEFAAEVGKLPTSKPPINKVWKPPVTGVYKINTDAAMFKDVGVGLGGVVRDSVGEVVVSTCERVEGAMDVALAEALAVRHGLQIAIEAGFSSLVLEMDNFTVYSKLQRRKQEASTLGSILHDIHRLANQCFNVSFSFVKREGNGVAHALAKLSCKFEGLRVWLEEYPSEVLAAVMADLFAGLD